MPFTISPLLYTDIPAFALADEAANADWPYARAQEIPGIPRHVFVEEWTKKDWGKDPTLHWMKAANAETGEFAAVALWKFPDSTVEGEGGKSVGEAGDMEKAARQGDKGNVEGAAAEIAAANPGLAEAPEDIERVKHAAGNAEMMATMKRQWETFTEKYIGDRPFAALLILMTHPKYQRQGAGSMLVRWGCERADSLGLLSALTASAAGEKVYTKHGFEIKEMTELDLRPYGQEATELRRRMIRLTGAGEHVRSND